MDIKQAEKQFAKFTSDDTEGHLDVSDFMDFCNNFANLMEQKKMPQGSINLFSNVIALFLWSDDYLAEYNKVEFIIEKYLEIMKNQ